MIFQQEKRPMPNQHVCVFFAFDGNFSHRFGFLDIVTDEPVRIKDVTTTHEPPSEILYIRGLTRPFSLMQLKDLLSRYGKLVDGGFWLDKIKSQCFVTVTRV